MKIQRRVQCPHCGFAVFNRRVAKCESCATTLPTDFLFTERELSILDTENQRNEKIRADLARQARELEEKRAKRRGDGG